MHKSKFFISTIVLIFISTSLLFAKQTQESKSTPSNATTIDNGTYVDANKVLMFITNHGNFGRDLSGVFGYDYGTFVPYRGDPNDISNNVGGAGEMSPLYAAGIWIGGKVNNEIRLAISEYDSEYTPGPMANGTFMSDRPEFKVYKLYSDSLQSNPNDDYRNWPADQGAPVDELGRPLMRGEQMLWSVFNDANPAQHINGSAMTAPLGLEIQMSTWAQNEDGTDTILTPTSFEVTQLGENNLVVSVNITDVNALKGHDYSVTYQYDSLNARHWDLNNLTTGVKVLENQTNFRGSNIQVPLHGISVSVEDIQRAKEFIYESATPQNLSPVVTTENPSYTGGRWFTGGNHGGDLLFGGVFIEPNFWGETTVGLEEIPTVEVRWRPMESYTDLNGDGTYTIGEPFVVDEPWKTQKAFMYSNFSSNSFLGFFDVPFTVWDVSDIYYPRQLNVVIRDRDQNHAWNLHIDHDPNDVDTTNLPNGGDLQFNYTMITNSDYDPSGTLYGDGTSGTIGWWEQYAASWVMWLDERGTTRGMLAEECVLTLVPGPIETISDTFVFNTTPYTPITTGGDGLAVYMMYKLFNKGGNFIDSCYFSLWADPDLGDAGDDLVGCDSLSDLFYCYNASNNDAQYGMAPPAIGFKIIHGPLVPSFGDNALFDENVVPNYKNLNMSTFFKYFNGTEPQDRFQTFDYMKGLNGREGSIPYVYNGDTLTYMHSGDPVTGTGDNDFSPADRRMMGTVGPFDFAPGDSQYVMIKMAVTQGSDHLSSITKVKEILNAPYRVPTDIDDKDNVSSQLPLSFMLAQNYPNPFNPTTQIQFSIPTRSDVTIEIFNVLGQKVTTLIDKNLSAGNHIVDWDASDVSTGLYIYKMTASDFVNTKKMMLLK